MALYSGPAQSPEELVTFVRSISWDSLVIHGFAAYWPSLLLVMFWLIGPAEIRRLLRRVAMTSLAFQLSLTLVSCWQSSVAHPQLIREALAGYLMVILVLIAGLAVAELRPAPGPTRPILAWAPMVGLMTLSLDGALLLLCITPVGI